jgi:HEPN domain-containing protein
VFVNLAIASGQIILLPVVGHGELVFAYTKPADYLQEKGGRDQMRQSSQLALAHSDIAKAEKRLKVLSLLLQEEAYSDVVREAQELAELAMKGILFQAGIDPPKEHDIGQFIRAVRDRLPQPAAQAADRLAAISGQLGRERNASFYGNQNFIPSERYTCQEARQAIEDAQFAYQLARAVISKE